MSAGKLVQKLVSSGAKTLGTAATATAIDSNPVIPPFGMWELKISIASPQAHQMHPISKSVKLLHLAI